MQIAHPSTGCKDGGWKREKSWKFNYHFSMLLEVGGNFHDGFIKSFAQISL